MSEEHFPKRSKNMEKKPEAILKAIHKNDVAYLKEAGKQGGKRSALLRDIRTSAQSEHTLQQRLKSEAQAWKDHESANYHVLPVDPEDLLEEQP